MYMYIHSTKAGIISYVSDRPMWLDEKNPHAILFPNQFFRLESRAIFRITQPTLKVICYGSDPVVISLQLTNFQSLISLRMNYKRAKVALDSKDEEKKQSSADHETGRS